MSKGNIWYIFQKYLIFQKHDAVIFRLFLMVTLVLEFGKLIVCWRGGMFFLKKQLDFRDSNYRKRRAEEIVDI